MTGSRRRVPGGYGLAVGVLVAGAVAATWVLTRGASTALVDLDPPVTPVAATVSTATLDYAADAALSAGIGEGPGVLATALAGTVTDVDVQAGDEVTSGAVLYTVDGVPVVAYMDDSVIYRALKVGDDGPDVTAAQRLLGALTGRDVPTDGHFGNATDLAVRAYERQIGVSRPTGILDPAWFARLPGAPFVVGALKIQPGQPAPAAGEVVATAAATATAITLVTDSAGPAGEYEFLVQGQPVPVVRGEDGTWQITDLTAATRVLLTGDVTDTEASVSGRLRMLDGPEGQAVPGAAVVTDPTGATCVVLSGSDEIVRADIVGTSADGLARITTVLPAGASVLLNPIVVLGDITCPSS